MIRRSSVEYIPFLVPLPRRRYDIFGVGAAVQGASSIAAAGTQAGAEDNAANLEYQAEQNSLNFSENEFNTQQANEAPWLNAGKSALGTLATDMGKGGSLSQSFSPTAAGLPSTYGNFSWNPQEVANDPAYQFTLQQGTQALNRQAAATGQLNSGGTLKALAQYAEGTASQYENQDYNQAQNTYLANQQAYQQNYSNAFNTFNTNQNNQFNRLASLAGIGQTANSTLASAGANAANTVSNTSLSAANAIGNAGTGAANAIGAGVVGAGNAIANYGAYQQYQQNQALQNANNPNYGPYGTYTGGGSYNVPYQPDAGSDSEYLDE